MIEHEREINAHFTSKRIQNQNGIIYFIPGPVAAQLMEEISPRFSEAKWLPRFSSVRSLAAVVGQSTFSPIGQHIGTSDSLP